MITQFKGEIAVEVKIDQIGYMAAESIFKVPLKQWCRLLFLFHISKVFLNHYY